MAGAVGSLTYTTDIIEAVAGNGSVGDFQWSWSLSVEEQFYLIWPVLLLFVPAVRSWKWAVAALAATVVAQWAWRGVIIASDSTHERLFYAPDTHVDALVVGTIIAIFAFNVPISGRTLLISRIAGLAGAVGLLILLAGKLSALLLARVDDGGFGSRPSFPRASSSCLPIRPMGGPVGFSPCAP